MSHASASPAATARLDNGVRLVCADGRAGDVIEVHEGDDVLASAPLRRRPGGGFSAHIPLREVPDLAFPARLRLLNVRAGTEIPTPILIPDAAALLAGAGPPVLTASFAGLHPAGLAFGIETDRLARQPRDFVLSLNGREVATAQSVPGPPPLVVFPLATPIAPGTEFTITEALFGVTAVTGVFDSTLLLASLGAQTARLQNEVDGLRQDNATLRRRLDTLRDLGRESLLLDRLDLFYLLLSERLDRAAGPRPLPSPDPPPSRLVAPADIDGLGLFDVETDGTRDWRWFGPDVTLALRGISGPVRRVILLFHGFAGGTEPPAARVSTGGPPAAARWLAMEDRHALDIPVPTGALLGGDMLVVHVSFDRHVSTAADPRLLSAVFIGAEIQFGSA